MELTKLFVIQAGLKKHVGYKGKDKFSKMMLAMLVEFMECANDWRGFKYWSENPKAKETLLEEYVDGFHFVLETGLDLKEHTIIMTLPNGVELPEEIHDMSEQRIIKQYKILTGKVLELEIEVHNGIDYMDGSYGDFIYRYLLLGKLLGFTEEQIEHAYIEKNKVNHDRQDNGY
ncbi:dUTP diphosphatase [Bacillus luti]|uniref:dUTP diphosphatase n=1 Tax=Bacillus luti TaxID=2026191 RepID=UPI003771EA04